jgi:hypothetical protein
MVGATTVMPIEQESMHGQSPLRLCVVTEPDPDALMRVLEPFRNINVIARRVVAETVAVGTINMELDVVGMSEGHLSRIAAKLSQQSYVVNTCWRRI